MQTLVLEPAFIVDFNGDIKTGCVEIEGDKIVAIGSASNAPQKISLKNQVLMPGFVNAHSHAFHRLLRGLCERKSSSNDDFWSWRQKMYALAENLNPDDLRLIATFVYGEMLEAGFTDVGEFHYFHHYANDPDPLAMSRALVDAAREVSINLVLLTTAYGRHNFLEPRKKEQERFGFLTVKDFLAHAKETYEAFHKKSQSVSVGCAIHSVRAVAETWFEPINDFANTHHMPLHIHASEQEAEVSACIKASGLSPIALLHRHHLLLPRTTLVHATHLVNDDIDLIKKTAPIICICPSTEKNLGDGIIPLSSLDEHNVRICIGTDQHVRLDPFGEVLSLEELERLRLKRRAILGTPGQFLHQALLPSLHKNGVLSLYPHEASGSLENSCANLVGIELPPEYLWHGPDVALDAMLLAPPSPPKIKTVIARGEMVVSDGTLKNHDKHFFIKEIKKIFAKINIS